MEIKYKLNQLEETSLKVTQNFNHKIILISGEMGAGKTTLIKQILIGLNVIDNISSPTFSIINEYTTKSKDLVYHMDLYRLSGSENDLLPLNLDNVFTTAISLIEWPSRLSKKPDERLEITLTIDSSIEDAATPEEDDGDDSKYRRMKLVPFGKKWTERLQFLQSEGLLEDLM